MLKGLETLDLRMRAHSDNAQRLAEWLAEHSLVEAVHYCGLPDHPGHALAVLQQQGFGGVLAFEVAGGREAAWQLINGTELMSLTANLGDADHHRSSSIDDPWAPDSRAAGISEGLVRIAVGLEDLADLQSDCLRGFAALSR